jgi:predicted Rossmann-fold nucleotide-binding protein
MGSSSDPHEQLSAPLGAWLGTLDVHLLTGAGQATMTAVSRAFAEVTGRRGLVIGVCPSADDDPGATRPGYPNPWVELPIVTHLPLSGPLGTEDRSRNHINVLSSTVVVALPGGDGTASEVHLAVRYGRPVIAFVEARSDIPQLPAVVPATRDLAEVKRFVRAALAAARETSPDGATGAPAIRDES